MAKWAGNIGYGVQTEIEPGVWDYVITERPYRGSIIRRSRRNSPGEGVTNSVRIENELSIIADPYAMGHMSDMVYVVMYGTKWNVESVEIEHPRITIHFGGEYNG